MDFNLICMRYLRGDTHKNGFSFRKKKPFELAYSLHLFKYVKQFFYFRWTVMRIVE